MNAAARYLGFVEAEHVGVERTAHEALRGVGIVEESDLQRDRPLLPQIQGLDPGSTAPVPDMNVPPVVTCSDITPELQPHSMRPRL